MLDFLFAGCFTGRAVKPSLFYGKFFLQSLQEKLGGFGKYLILFPGERGFRVNGRFQRAGAKVGAGGIYELIKGDGIA